MNADWAWAAGLFEGEGSIVVRERQVVICLRTTDLDVLRKFVAIVGYGQIRPVKLRPFHNRQQHAWFIGHKAEVFRILTAMRPWLGERRGAKADEALEWIARRDGHPPFSSAALTALTRASA